MATQTLAQEQPAESEAEGPPTLISQESLSGESLRKMACDQATKAEAPAAEPRIKGSKRGEGTGTSDPFAELLRWAYAFDYSIAARSSSDEIHGEIFFDVDESREGAGDPLEFTITEGTPSPGVEGVPEDALQVTISLKQKLPARVGQPLIEIENYTCRRGGDGKRIARFLFVGADGRYLTSSAAMRLPRRKFILPGLDVLERNLAKTSLTRKGGTAEVAAMKIWFANPMSPLVAVTQRVNIATVASPGEPSKRTLERHLYLLYKALFARARNGASLCLSFEASFVYSVGPDRNELLVALPVLLQPGTDIVISDSSITKMAAEQAEACDAWMARTEAPSQNGEWRFGLTLFSPRTEKLPISKMSGLYLRVADVGTSPEAGHAVEMPDARE